MYLVNNKMTQLSYREVLPPRDMIFLYNYSEKVSGESIQNHITENGIYFSRDRAELGCHLNKTKLLPKQRQLKRRYKITTCDMSESKYYKFSE